eukprot:TRINITY_DN39311_c0_g1_i1.p1 TRINITY_DN39311_c0_g1~~TRINITY_DN39311_c0_g1_i1.p1  ORF type:complete len:705 (-),score=136.87 TRINITY_DN39311_c0_g1_i1:105-2219(-)
MAQKEEDDFYSFYWDLIGVESGGSENKQEEVRPGGAVVVHEGPSAASPKDGKVLLEDASVEAGAPVSYQPPDHEQPKASSILTQSAPEPAIVVPKRTGETLDGEVHLEHASVEATVGAPVSYKPDHEEPETAAILKQSASEPAMVVPGGTGGTSTQPVAKSLDDAIAELGMLQIVLTVPTMSVMRAGRPLKRLEHELYVAQFVLQSTSRKFNSYLGTQEGKCDMHPFLSKGSAGGHIVHQGKPGASVAAAVRQREDGSPQLVGDDGGSFGWLDDGTSVVYQTNGIARTEEPILSMPIKCSRTGAPGHYMETKMLVARRHDVKGLPASGLARAKSMRTRKDIEDNLFYSFTSCWQIYACSASVGQLGEDDSGERILVRRSVKDFTQHHFHDFPVAKHLAELLDRENTALIKAFCFDAKGNEPETSFEYECYTLRSWQTYECEGKPPETDVGRRLVEAARIGHVAELKRLVQTCGCDCDARVAEFGCIGSGRMGIFTRSECGYAEERTALIAAVEAGWLSVVQTIIDFAADGNANLNIVCHEWNPKGIGGDCLRPSYTALDKSRLYHRREIEEALLKSKASSHKQCKIQKRENPFDVRLRQDRGESGQDGYERHEHQDRYADFTFADWGDDVKMDPEMHDIVEGLKKEMQEFAKENEVEQTKLFRKLCLRWHPDKHPDEKKALATRVFQWIQHTKTSAWENKAWTA